MSKEKIYQELDIKCLQFCRWYRKFWLFYKVSKNERPKYLFKLISVRSTPYATRTAGNVLPVKRKLNFFKNSSFPSAIIQRYILEPSLNTFKTFSIFKEKFHNSFPKFFFDCHKLKEVKLITRLRIGLSQLKEHKFKHSFQDAINPLHNCGQDIESSTIFSSTVTYLLIKDALLLALCVALKGNC